MMSPSLDPGLQWVETRIRQLSAKLGRPVDCLEWPRPKELLEVEGDPEVQRRGGGEDKGIRIVSIGVLP
jgi:hypothetical protein